MGYSFGADILPFAFNRLPEAQRNKVQLLSLLGLDTTTDFEIHVAGCLVPPLAAAKRIKTPGGDHFNGDYVGLAKRILDGAERRRPSSAVPSFWSGSKFGQIKCYVRRTYPVLATCRRRWH